MLLSDAAMDSVISGRSLKETLKDLWDEPTGCTEFLDTVCDQLAIFRTHQEAMITLEVMTGDEAKDFRKRANNVCNDIGRQVRGLTEGEFTIKCVSRKDGHKYEAVSPTPRAKVTAGPIFPATPAPEIETYSAEDVVNYHDNKCTNAPMDVLNKLLDIHGDDTFKDLLISVVSERG